VIDIHRVIDLVGVQLVPIASRADPALELNAAALLDDVRGGVEARRAHEGDVITGGERLRPHRLRRLRGRTASVRVDAADIVAAEQPLDRLGVRQRACRASDTSSRRGVHLSIAAGHEIRLCPRRPAPWSCTGAKVVETSVRLPTPMPGAS
jgi:hypothetical protein